MYELQETNNEIVRNRRPGKAFAVGALVGVGLALLLAPATGREARRRIGQTARRVGTGARGVFGKTRETINSVREDARSAITTGRETFEKTRRPEEQHAGWHAGTP